MGACHTPSCDSDAASRHRAPLTSWGEHVLPGLTGTAGPPAAPMGGFWAARWAAMVRCTSLKMVDAREDKLAAGEGRGRLPRLLRGLQGNRKA